jgi:hypothetical protein
MARADYTYKTTTCSGRNVIAIEDLDLGNTSVTNDIETVIKEIAAVEKIDPKKWTIVYADSDGTWDGYDYSSKEFILLNEGDYRDAVDKYLMKQLNHAMS